MKSLNINEVLRWGKHWLKDYHYIKSIIYTNIQLKKYITININIILYTRITYIYIYVYKLYCQYLMYLVI